MLVVAEDAVPQVASRRRLADRRKALGLTQEKLAELLSVDRSTVTRWERGETRPLPHMQPKLARALRVSADDLQELLGDGATSAGGREADPTVVPRELPGDVAMFTGRAAELAELERLVVGPVEGAGARKSTAAVIWAVSGTAGVGKTALAVHWAHMAARQYADGQLYVNLRGYDLDQPMPASDALSGFLRSLGVPGQDIPPEGNERATRYRSLLADKRVLIVLDNASSVEQVRPLLPGSSECAVLVTSRDSLAGLVARDGAKRIDLDLLPAGDAVTLLRELIGARVDAETGAAVTLAELCARLPLALRVAAELAAARPGVPLTELVTELSDQRQRLDLLEADGDPRTAMRAVFSWSYRSLDEGAARLFRLAGLHPGPDFDAFAAAALTDGTLAETRRTLTVLTHAHLIQADPSDRHSLHDLLRVYAGELSDQEDSDAVQREALTRLFDYYLWAAAAAMDTLQPAERYRRPRISAITTPARPLGDPDEARAWLDTELATLLAVASRAAEDGWPGHATRLDATIDRYLQMGSRNTEAVAIHGSALRAARIAGDQTAEATALLHLGNVTWRQGQYEDASRNYEQALALFRATGDRSGEARALGSLGFVAFERGAYEQTSDFHRQALALFREMGDRNGEALALNALAGADEHQGRYEDAARHHRQALELFRAIGNQTGQAVVLNNLTVVNQHLGQYREAADNCHQALGLHRELGDARGEAYALTSLGAVHLQQGHYEEATAAYQQSVALFRQLGIQAGEASALSSLGEAFRAAGQLTDARAQYAAALALANQIGHKHQRARGHHGLGRISRAEGNLADTRRHWEEALELFGELGSPTAEELRLELMAIEPDQSDST